MPDQPRRAPAASEIDPVRLEGVGFGYGDGPEVLRDVNLNLTAGSFHFLTGPSGAGKSSLLRLMALVERPRGGRINLFGQDTAAAPRRALPAIRRRMGVVFQDLRLLDHLSAFDNVALPLRLAGGKARDHAENVREMLAWVGLRDREDTRPPALSGAERQRLAIARAVVDRPNLILADEPFSSQDAAVGERLLGLFQSLNRLGTTVLIATRDPTPAALPKATVLRLHAGRLEHAA